MLTRMTDPLLSLESERVPVQPGGQARVTVRITNPGAIVEGYALDVVGDGPAQWAEVVPPTVSIYPQQETSVVVVFSPPAGAGAAGGLWPFGVRAQSQDDPNGSAVAEGDLDINRLVGLQAKLVPVTSSGRWRGRHTVQLSNWGNTPVRLRLVAADPDEALGFLVRPEEVDLQLGGSTTARVHVRTRRPVLRGTAPRLPFTVTAERTDVALTPGPTPVGAAPDRPVLNGAFQQRPIVSGTAVLLSLLLLAGLVVGAVFTLNGPASAEPSAYRDVAKPPQPRGVKAEAADPTTIEVRWEPIQDVDEYRVTAKDLAVPVTLGETAVKAPVNRHVQAGLAPGKEYCFEVTAVDDGVAGDASDRVCATTPVPEPTPTATPSTSPSASPTDPGASTAAPTTAAPTTAATGEPSPSGPGGGGGPAAALNGNWVLVVGLEPSISLARAEELRDRLVDKGFADAGVLEPGQYGDLEISALPGIETTKPVLVYVGVEDDPADLVPCDAVQKAEVDPPLGLLGVCYPVQPDP
jgi:hypothetical protein